MSTLRPAFSMAGANGQPDQTASPQLSAAAAVALAIPMAQAARGIKTSLQEDRGGIPVDFDALAPCGDPVYAHSLYNDPSSITDRLDRLVRAPQWIVTFCASGVPQLSIAVSSFATDLRREGNVVIFPARAGGEFWPRGIPPEWEGGIAVSASTAATLAAQAMGRAVAGQPELLSPPRGVVPQMAQWLVRLAPDPASGDKGPDEVLVGLRMDGQRAIGPTAVQVQAFPAVANRDGGPTGFRTTVKWDRATRATILTAGRN